MEVCSFGADSAPVGLNALPSRPISCGDGDTPWKRHLSPRRVVAGSRGRGFQARPAGSTPRYVGNSTQVSAFEMLCVCRRRLTRPPSNCHRSVWFGSIAPKLPKPRRRVCMNSRQRSAYRDGSLQHRRNGRERLRRLCGGCTSGEVARSPYVSGRRVTPGKQQRSIHTERGTGIRNPFCRSHKSNMVSIVATHSWRPRWVTFRPSRRLRRCPILLHELTLQSLQSRRLSFPPSVVTAESGLGASAPREPVVQRSRNQHRAWKNPGFAIDSP